MTLERIGDDVYDVYCGPRRLPLYVRREEAEGGGHTYSVCRTAAADGAPTGTLAGGFAAQLTALRWIENNWI
jgi:hypothetical protein